MKDYTRLINAVMDDRRFTRLDKVVYWAIRCFRNGKTGACFPGLATVARLTPCSRSSVQRALAKLKSAGFIDWKSGNGSKSNRYIFPREDVPTSDHTHAFTGSSASTPVFMDESGLYAPVTTEPDECNEINEPTEASIYWRERTLQLQAEVRKRKGESV